MVAEVEEMRQSKDGFSDIFFPRNHSRGTDKNQRALKTALKMDKRPKDFQLYPGWKPMRFDDVEVGHGCLGDNISGLDEFVALDSSESPFQERSSDHYTTHKRRRHACGAITTFTEGRRAISYAILYSYESLFQRFSFLLARKTLAAFSASLIVLVASCLGFYRLSVEPPSSKHFTVTDSQSRLVFHHAAQFFPLLDARKEHIIMTPKNDQNVLIEDCLKDAVLVHQAVLNISGYKNLCFRQRLPESISERRINQNCIISSPLELAGAHFEHLSNLSSILAREFTNPCTVLSTGQSFQSSFKEMLSGFQVDRTTNPKTARADALQVIYFIRKAINEEEEHEVVNFEASFANHISSMNYHLKCVTLSLKTGKDTTDAFQKMLQPELRPLYLSSLAMVFLVFFVIYLSSSNPTCVTTVVLTFSSILFPLVCAVGIISVASIFLSPVFLFIPFLILGKSTSDVVFVLEEWEGQKKVGSLEHRVSGCVARAGIPQVFSAFCGTICLGIAIKSSFEAVSEFFLVALAGFVMVSIASFIITVILLLSLERQLQTGTILCSWHCGERSPFLNVGRIGRKPLQHLKAEVRHLVDSLAGIITTSLAVRVSVFLILVSTVSLCVWSASQSGERTSGTSNFHRKSDNLKQFIKVQQRFFTKETDVSIVFFDKADYSQETLQKQMINICTTLREASYSHGKSSCWMAALLHWARQQNMSCSNSDFHRCLKIFLNQPQSVSFRQDVRFEENFSTFQILATRFHLQMALYNHFKEDKRTVEKLRNDLSKKSAFQASPVSDKFFELDDLISLERDAVFVVMFASTVVFISCLLSSASFGISGYLVVTLNLLVFEALGIMKAWGIPLNHISFISLFLTIVLALIFSFQVSYSFTFSAKQKVKERMIKAMCSVYWPLLIAALLEICGSVSLGFVYPSLTDIFFRLVPLVIILGLLHALVIFPVTMTSFFETLEGFYSKNDLEMLLNTKARIVKMSPQGRDCDAPQVKPKRPGISIVGMACRFPGANSKDMFWNLLQQGKSSIGAFPQNRKEQHQTFFELYHPKRFVSGRLCAVNGSYLEDIANFDNRFFGISNQEARVMDPQQRILLEVVYEAIEDAGIPLEDLQKCRTGVFVGVMNLEYGALITDPSNYNNIDQFSSTGMTASILANRVSFCLNLTGPSIAVDTACSSSLTALKLACDNLHNEDCEIAIVCAPNIVLNHATQMASSMAGLLAPDGRCKSFDASGDGYGRGEGFAAVVLKLSHAALNDKDDAYCEIIACGMNNDGKNSVPMTAPSAKTQAELFRMVLDQSGVSPEDVDYIEAHGTGTAIGDVIEVNSIADTYTRGKVSPARKLRVGSVKSNLNHTESTSGLAGLLKVALMIKIKRLVPTINVHVLNPKLKLEEKGLVVQKTSEPWNTENGKLRIGAVNSFGYGGSNAHTILREVRSRQILEEKKVERLNHVLTLSARSEEALKRMAGLYSKWLYDSIQDKDSTFVENICYSLNERRSQFQHRLALPFRCIYEACKSLADYAEDSMGWPKEVSYGEVKSSDPRLVFMFGGQGSQWFAMGRQLIETEPVFKAAISAVSNLVRDMGKTWSLIDTLMATEDESRIAENTIAQAATFAVQYATAQLLMSWRIYPSAVLGHSLGEFAAACVAEIITLEEAVQLVLTRSSLQEQCPNNGGMAALGMSKEKAKALLMKLNLGSSLNIAAVNDAKSVTVSGDSQSIEALGQHLAVCSKDTFWRVLRTKRAFHSSQMELIKKRFQAAMKGLNLKPQLSKIPMYSTVEGEVIPGEHFNSDYWWRNIRCPVQFYPAMKHLLKDGYMKIIEISTQPILAHYVKQIAVQEKLQDQAALVVLKTLPRERVPVREQHKSFLMNTVCKLYTLGFPIDWTCVERNESAKFVRLLTYPWKKESFWYREQPPQTTICPLGADNSARKKKHPFLGKVVMTDLYSGLHCWETEIDLHRFANLKDHALIKGGAVMPGAAYLEMVFAMVRDQFVNAVGVEITDVKLFSLLTLPETQVRCLRLRLLKNDRIDEAQFHITSVKSDQSEMQLSTGNISVDLLHEQDNCEIKASNQIGPAVSELITFMSKMPMERFREITERCGFSYGPTFSIIKKIWKCGNEGLCLVDINGSMTIQTEEGSFVVHPSILDACLQSCFIPMESSLSDDKSVVPVGFSSITLNNVPSTNQLYCHVIADVAEFGRFEVKLMSPSGNVLLTMKGFRVAELTRPQRQLSFAELAYEVQWKEDKLQRQMKSMPHLTCIVLKESSDFSDRLVTALQEVEVDVITLNPPNVGCFDAEVEETTTRVFEETSLSNLSNLRVINLWPLEASLLADKFEVIEHAQSLAFSSSVYLLKQMQEKKLVDSQLFLVTACTQLLDACDKASYTKSIPWGSTVWGLRRTANLEESNVRVTTVDLCNKEDQDEVNFLVDEVLGDSNENEVAFRHGKRFINRLVRTQIHQETTTVTSTKDHNERTLMYLSTTTLSRTLCLREQSLAEPSQHEVAMNVHYCWTPSQSLSDIARPNGFVFVSGKVTNLSAKSKHAFQVGEYVCGVISSGRVGSSVPINVRNAFVKPAFLTVEQATYIPACLALALLALQRAASDAENQTLMIHEANRGPGPAAVLLGKTLGHRVLCSIPDTSRMSTKRKLLKLGAEVVERQNCSTLYDDQFDAVVFFFYPAPNALRQSIGSLKKGGKVIVLSSEFNGDVVFSANKNVKYERCDISDILQSPRTFEKLSLEGLEILKNKGGLEQLLGMQVESIDLVASIKAANRTIGKRSSHQRELEVSSDISYLIQSLATFQNKDHLEEIPLLPPGLDKCGLKENRTYLVAGGMGGFGFEVACWMAENGAKTIGLLGRSKPSDAKRQELGQIEMRTGAKIHTFQVDISNQKQMLTFKDQLQSLPSVAGIVHTAMVLRDQFIKDLTFQSFSEVMAPKVKGSFLLHQMSLEMDLDFFVMFSSMASIVGNMGQSSYSACNAFQDSLAQYRRHVLGLPGLAINWGPISGAGVMERETGVAKLVTLAGLGFVNAKEGVKYMAKVLTEEPGRCQISLFDADWPRFLKSNAGLRKTPRLSVISNATSASESQTSSTESLAQRIILEKDQEKRAELVNEYVGMSVTEWTGISSPSEMDLNKSLYSYGVDSTAALTLKMQLETNLQVSFEVFYFMQPDTTPLKLARDIAAKLSGKNSDSQHPDEQPRNGDCQETEPAQRQADPETSRPGDSPGNQIQIIPLYTPEGSTIKFFCVHPSHRYAMSLVPMSTGFQGQDLVSFYALGFTDPTVVSEDWGGVRELAKHYVQLIRKEQRHGPYFLGGYSYGGLLAYEIASLLTEKNQKVAFVAMIDTFPWFPHSRTISARLVSMQQDENSQRKHVKLQFENYLKKLAIDSLKMTVDEYRQLREEHNQKWVINELQRRSLEKGLAAYNLSVLKDSLLRDQSVATRTHHEWQPAEVRYRGPLTFLKCQNTRFSPRLHSLESAEECWGQLVDGGTTVLVCPGDHYTMSELPNARVTGSVLATALAFSYRVLFPEFLRPTRTFSQRRAVEKLCDGVDVFLHSKRGNKKPHFGELHFVECDYKLELRSQPEEGVNTVKEKTKKIIDLADLRMVQPGRLVSNALKHADRKRRVGANHSGNLGQIASVVTSRRVYNLEFTNYSDLKTFNDMIEAVFGVPLLSK